MWKKKREVITTENGKRISSNRENEPDLSSCADLTLRWLQSESSRPS